MVVVELWKYSQLSIKCCLSDVSFFIMFNYIKMFYLQRLAEERDSLKEAIDNLEGSKAQEGKAVLGNVCCVEFEWDERTFVDANRSE